MEESRATGETSIRDFATIILRRKWVILGLVLASTVYVGWKAAKATVDYRSYGQILIRPGERSSTLVANLEFRPWEEVMNSEIMILTSQPIADRAGEILRRKYEAEGIPGRPPWVDRYHIGTDARRNSNIIDVSYYSTNQKIVRESLDAILEAYISLHKELFELPDAHEMFNQEVMRAQRDLEVLERERREYAEKMGVASIKQEKEAILLQLRILKAKRADLELRIASASTRIDESLRLRSDGPASTLPAALPGSMNENVQDMMRQTRQELGILESREREILSKYKATHPEVGVLREQIRELKERMRRYEEIEIQMRESDLNVLRQELNTLNRQVAQWEADLASYPEKEMTMNQYERSLGLVTNTFKELLAKEMHMKISEVSARDYEVVVLSPATRPQATNPRDPVRLMLAPALSLFLSIGLAFFLDRLDHSLRSREDVENYLGLRVLSSVPEVRLKRR